jgi:carbon storage regulator
MLVLTRRLEERIVIDDSVVVTILRIDGGRVALGFEAPSDVRIFRQELLNPNVPFTATAEATAIRQ